MGQGLAFHAAPPDGHWINDPNALLFADGRYRLFAQHRSDAPEFQATGWARFSSSNLVDWSFDGAVIPPDGDRWAYSGSVFVRNGRLEAFHTEHYGGLQRQLRRTSRDGGLHWTDGEPVGPPPARNSRDPFLFFNAATADWRMLLARPCDWNDWRGGARSELMLLRSDGHLRDWEQVGRIGPWAPEGVLWEVPLLIPGRDCHVLIVSVVDRRRGGASSSVSYWFGRFDGSAFNMHDGEPPEGRLLDLGPDFYAAMISSPSNWPTMGPLLVGWLGNWETARRIEWPGFSGGPISIPRMLDIDWPRRRLVQHPAREVRGQFVCRSETAQLAGLASAGGLGNDFILRIEAAGGMVTISQSGPIVTVERTGSALLHWNAVHRLSAPADRFALFFDGPALELFLEPSGQCCSIVLPNGGRPFRMRLECGGIERPLAYHSFA
jgi:sucrose-6-phosphate hydrolase SacC (GH32 family)